MADVFVSYKAEDRRRVKPLVDALEADGFSVWWDAQIGGGSAWRHEIEAELNAAKCVIVLWSKHSVGPDGAFVQDEASRAQQRRVYVPVTIDKVHLPLGFGETQELALTGWHGNRFDPRYRAVLAAVERKAGVGRGGTSATPHEGRFDRRTAIGVGAVALAAAAGAGGWLLLKRSSAIGPSDSIAVLPFENLSGDPNQAYFSDGIAEEIRSTLARLSGLTVIGRSSSEAVRNDDARTAARKLGVRNILTGTVRQSPSTIRITAELVDGRTGADRWSQDYNRAPGDAIRIQTDIAENVANALSIQLLPGARSRLMAAGTANPLAHDAYLQGLALARANGDEQLDRQALQLFDRAIALDPAYADAFASKAELLTILAFYDPTDATTRSDLAKALASAQNAYRLAPARANTNSALGVVLESLNSFEGASHSFERATQLGADADTLRRIALFKARIGAAPQALQLIQRARQLDPLNPDIQADLGIVLYYGRDYGRAIEALSAFLRDQPNASRLRDYLLRALLLAGRSADAQAQLPQISTQWLKLVDDALLTARSGNRRVADRALVKVLAINADLIAYQLAQIHAWRGEKDAAFADLRKAIQLRDAGLQALPSDPFFDPLRSDPRFHPLVNQLRFPA
jgi:serine/threonine-protein kinase